MTALKEIGEIGISDSREGGKDFLLRPSFAAMARLGEPAEIVRIYGTVNGSDAQQLLVACVGALKCIPAWVSPSFNLLADRLLSAAMHVMQACCEEDLTAIIGEWKGWSRYVVYRPGMMPRNDIVVMAQQLLQHGVIGKAKVRRLQRHESGETTSEFRAFDYISAARSHFGMGRDEAAALTMTEFQLLLAAKYPDQKGFTREEYDAVAEDYMARKTRRLANCSDSGL
ncbi:MULTISPECIES: DUF6246 family protein [Phytobacter]|uniref:Uncharacterized protein n=1 Tax=Phytobacter diazotrophicus TaxID=395631 RepID=A0ABN6LNF7_9ENTR|nr:MULTISPECIES: DUF6246 family protein [Phytobacter]MDU4154665.1 DUF6246 family protein [Enterobacteriaceae bacterium]MDU7380679.1 DUF6246 family protein [Enterobacteriaceae bacterium]BBE77226.1 hypothetical protein MRY16398_22820 [Phytobacter sp. MRY16-398]BDD50694.1 hypothetical protein PDTA9734_21810 [Phytobacter diazotrophicus]BEG81723.1 DUF6246 family protein [Phytobacter diazotrophicus]